MVLSVLGAVAKGTNFNGVILGVQSLSMYVIDDFQVGSFVLFSFSSLPHCFPGVTTDCQLQQGNISPVDTYSIGMGGC